MAESVLGGMNIDVSKEGRHLDMAILVLDYLDDGKFVDSEQMGVSTGSRRTVVQIHNHTRLLRTLASEAIDSGGLRNFSRASENLFAPMPTRMLPLHDDVVELDFEVVSWDNHTNKVDIITVKGC